MGIVSTSPMFYPDPSGMSGAYTGSNSDMRFQASTTKVARLFQVPHDLDGLEVSAITVRIGTAATPNELRAGLYTIDSAGEPTTTGYDGGGNNYGSASVSANSYVTINLSRNVTLTANEWVAVVFEPNDADAVDMYLGCVSSTLHQFGRTPKTMRYVAAWASTGQLPSFGLKTTGGTVITSHRTHLISDVNALNYNSGTSGTTGDENALKMVVPFGCRVAGVYASTWPIGGDRELILYYDNGASSKSTGTIDNELMGASTSASYFFFDATVELSAGDTLRIANKPTTTTNIFQYRAVFPDSSWVTQFGLPSGACRSYRVDGGSWTDVSDEIVLAGLIIDGLHDGTGGSGGLITHPGMAGGLRG